MNYAVTRGVCILLITLIPFLVWPPLAPAQQPAVLVNPHVQGRGTARTIQEGIDIVAEGGKVLVLPGTYEEALVIDKSLTLERVGGESGPVIIAPPGTPTTAIRVVTPRPVTIRDVTVQFTGANGIRGDGVVDVTVERVRVLAYNPPPGLGFLVAVINNTKTGRAQLTVRASFLDGTITCSVYPTACSPFDPSHPPSFPQLFGIRVQGDVNALLEGNVIRRTGGACISVFMRNDFGGETNVDIINNDVDECYPLGRAGAILVIAGVVPPPGTLVTAEGVANIVGNTIGNTFASCLTTTAISQSFAPGRIEHNRILGVVPVCATPTITRNPAAIWIGVLAGDLPSVDPIVRFNDIEGNAHAGLRVAPNITTVIDAQCNWWGSAGGPSVGTDPPGSDIVVDSPLVTPVPDFTPWATAPIAGTDGTACTPN